MSNSQLNKLKSVMKNGTEVTLKISSNVVGDSNDENDFLHILILTLMYMFWGFVKLLWIFPQLI